MSGLHWDGTLSARDHETSLEVLPGRVLAVVGPNGAGKSTLLDLLCGMLKPDRGDLSIDGQVLVDSRHFVPAHRRRIGLLGQQPLLFPHLDVLGNVAYGPRAQRVRRAATAPRRRAQAYASNAGSGTHSRSARAARECTPGSRAAPQEPP